MHVAHETFETTPATLTATCTCTQVSTAPYLHRWIECQAEARSSRPCGDASLFTSVVHTHTRIHIHTYICICMYLYMHTPVDLYVFIYIYIICTRGAYCSGFRGVLKEGTQNGRQACSLAVSCLDFVEGWVRSEYRRLVFQICQFKAGAHGWQSPNNNADTCRLPEECLYFHTAHC